MDKFYTVNEGSSLYDDYWAWKNCLVPNKKIVDDFFKEFGIEADLYCQNSTVIGIVPTENDKIKFAKQLCSKETDEGLRFFLKNSAINKEWVKRAVGLKNVHKPSPAWLNKYMGRSSSRLFDHNGILYCSFSANQIEMPSDVFTEIKGSEFYKVMEEIENGKTD
ncbi:hypothetical protein [Flintibacter muris]|uniref:hypothetical protein n=1 Tax=Flintibacter muris TaxID=2941327 RepID=UPI00203DE062|nr:hypothetical protein [Flintibacter muris]